MLKKGQSSNDGGDDDDDLQLQADTILYFVNYHLLGSPQLLRDGVQNQFPCAGFCRLAALCLPKTILGTLKHAGTASNKIRVSMKTLQSIRRKPSPLYKLVEKSSPQINQRNSAICKIVSGLVVIYIVQYHKGLHTLIIKKRQSKSTARNL